MQPQTPVSPTPQYDFILKDKQAPKKGLSLPALNLPKPIIYGLGVFIILIIFAIVASLLSSGSNNSILAYTSVQARAQEIVRVSTSVEALAQDAPTQDLATTTLNVLGNEQTRLSAYLTLNKIKLSTAGLAGDMNSATDTQMQTASTNGDLNAVFTAYLKSQLALYSGELQNAYKVAGSHGKTILSGDYTSTQTLLSDPQIAAAN
jgi:hypothetical protein